MCRGVCIRSRLDKVFGCRFVRASNWVELFSFEKVVVHKELFDLRDKASVQIIEGMTLAMLFGLRGNGDDPIVSHGRLFRSVLHGLNCPQCADFDNASLRQRFLEQEQHVERIAVFRKCRWHKTKMKWKRVSER